MEYNQIPKTGTIGGMVDNITANFQLTKEMLERLEVTKDHAVGLFSTLATLQAAHPTPEVGDWALVGDTTPFAIYKCATAGTWSDTGGTYDGGSIDLSDYATKEEFDILTRQPGDALPVAETSWNWSLISDGHCRQDTTAKMRKFAVTAGDILYLKLAKDTEGVYQFQSSDRVPSSGATYVVGSPVTTAIDGYVVVPEGATYLIISELKTNTTNEIKSSVKFSVNELKEEIAALGTELREEMSGIDSELKGEISNLGTELNGEITELSSDLNGYNEDFALTREGRYTSPDGIAFKAGVKYTVRATLAHTPSSYVAPDLRTSDGTKILDIGNLRNTDTKEVYYTPAEDITLYASVYTAAGSTDAVSMNLAIFSDDTISVKIADISSKFSFSSSKKIGNNGRHDYVDRFSLMAGEEYFLQSKLSNAPTGYIAVELRDANNTALVTLEGIRDSATHSATYTPTQDISDAFIYVYSSNSADREIVLSTKFGLVSTFDGEIVSSTRQMDIVSANMEAADKFLQLKRMPRVGGNTQGITPLVLLHHSDIHGSVENLQRIVQFYEAYKTKIDDVLNTGDTVYYESTDDFIVPMVNGASTQLLAIGNHDVKSGNSQITAAACYARYIAPYIATWGVVQPSDAAANGKCYYYKDYTAAKVRLIVLDCMFWDAAQNTWLAATLADAKTQGLAVVCATHFAGGKVTPYDIAWNTLQYDDVSTVINADAPSTVQTFINDGGEFVCWLSGHGHFDMVGTLDDYPQQLNIAVDTANYGSPSWYSDIQRTRYTKSEDLLNAFSVDTFNKTIRLFRVGADRDSQLRHRGNLLIKYTTLQVLYSD